jgi:hypothetical protein
VAGLTISAVGALAGGIGFFAGEISNLLVRSSILSESLMLGISVTSSILLVLGVLGAILDAILGAVNRSKLRAAINEACILPIDEPCDTDLSSSSSLHVSR